MNPLLLLRKLDTTRGKIWEFMLDKDVLDEEVPCGRSVTTTWRFNGEVVKRDVEIIASRPFATSTAIGGFTK